MKARYQARLKIIGEKLHPDTITVRVGLEPHRTLAAGDERPHTNIVETTNLSELHSGLPQDRDLAEHISALLKAVEPVADRIRRMASDHTILLSCVVHAPREPALALNREAIEKLARIGAEVDFDLYIGSDDAPQS